MLKPPNLSENAPWKQRYRASPTVLIEIAAANPDRGLVCSNQSGLYQLYTWDLVDDRIQQLTNHSTMVYKFTHLSQAEIKAMISIIDFTKEPRAIREAKDEGRQEGRQEGQELALQRERSLILRLLTKRLGVVEDAMAACVLCLSFDHLDALGEALLDFTDGAELAAWLRGNLTWITTPLIQQLGQDLPEATIVHLSTLPLAVLADLSRAIPEFTSMADVEQWLVAQE